MTYLITLVKNYINRKEIYRKAFEKEVMKVRMEVWEKRRQGNPWY